MSRAQWLAFGPSMALAACNGATESLVVEHGGSAQEAGPTAKSDLAAAGVACPTKSGFFACGEDVCDRALQACVQTNVNGLTGALDQQCRWYRSLASDAGCGTCPSCDCLLSGLSSGCNLWCSEDDAGSIAISCHSCYGSPPARLEPIA